MLVPIIIYGCILITITLTWIYTIVSLLEKRHVNKAFIILFSGLISIVVIAVIFFEYQRLLNVKGRNISRYEPVQEQLYRLK